jgi:hypothetical protein
MVLRSSWGEISHVATGEAYGRVFRPVGLRARSRTVRDLPRSRGSQEPIPLEILPLAPSGLFQECFHSFFFFLLIQGRNHASES